jgi:diguanylate cyclase (GGDEF)-like protein
LTKPDEAYWEERYRLTASLLEKATELISTQDCDELLDRLCQSLVEASAHILLVWIWTGSIHAQEIMPQIMAGPARDYARDLRIRRNWLTRLGPFFRVLDGERLCRMNISPAALYKPWRRAASRYGFQSAIALRLPFPGNQQVGVIVLYGDDRDYFTRVGDEPFHAFARSAQSILHQCALVARLKEEALTDALTGIPNRRAFRSELRRSCSLARRSDQLLCVGILDLDGLKKVNDRFGHEAGDRVIEQSAKRLSAKLRAGDFLARLGGDEFGLLIHAVSSVDNLNVFSERLLDALKEPIPLPDASVQHISASLGWTLFPLAEEDPETLIRQADMALYAAKQGGRDQYQLFSIGLEKERNEETRKRYLLGEALNQGQLVLYYQPILAANGKTTGVEALLRLQHPEQGLLKPNAFLSALDHPRLARAIGRFVLNAALAQAMCWQQMQLGLRVSLNISTRHLLDKEFPDDLQEVLDRYPALPHELIEIEVTESGSLTDLDAAQNILVMCRERFGLKTGLDDFGTGNASLTFLQKLPVNTVKIDQSFVRDMMEDSKDFAIVAAVITAANLIGLESVAEGVENPEIARKLIEMGCSHLQGYLFSPPLPAAEITDWMVNNDDIFNRLLK